MTTNQVRHQKKSERPHLLNDGKVAIGVAIGAGSSLFIFLILEAFKFEPPRKEFLELAPATIAILVAGTSSVLAFIALREQRRMREASSDPVLIAHFGQREDVRALVTFNLTNVGAGAATFVRLSVAPPNTDLKQRNLLHNIFVRHHPFRVIPQGQSITFSLGMGWDLLGDTPLPPFKVRLDYEDIKGTEYWIEMTLDIREMEMLGAEESLPTRTAKSLEAIAKGLADSQDGSKPIRTLTQTLAEKRKENEEWIAKIKTEKEN